MNHPIPEKKAYALRLHNHQRIDHYFWMRDRNDQKVIDHLNAENEYTNQALHPAEALKNTLYDEMKGRIKEDDSSAPYFKNGYWYYSRYEKGLGHPIYCRKKEHLKAKEEILLNENDLAEAHPYYEIVSFSVSIDNKWLAFAADTSGRRIYEIQFKNLDTGIYLDLTIDQCGSDIAWHNDNETFYFTQKDTETLRPYLVESINIKTKERHTVFQENDDTFIVSLDKTGDLDYLFIGSHSTLSTEFRFKSANDESSFEIFLARQKKHEYYPESAGDGFYIKSNLNAKNFKLVYCSIEKRHPDNWQLIQAHDPSILIEDYEVFDAHIVLQEKKNGLSQLRVYNRKDYEQKLIPPSEETYTLYLGTNPESEQKHVRIGYSSMTTPHTIFDIDLNTFERKKIKQSTVLGSFSPENYQSERVWATSHDGIEVPISLVYRKDLFKKDGSNPILIYAYGSYGSTIDPYFSSTRLSLLDRGFVFAIAHIRGGEYLGTQWYEDGKLLKKKNTFFDFIACTEHLIHEKYGNPQRIYAMGGSAGGLLMGAVANLRPDLWYGMISEVPFVDVISTMIDESIPLTTGEYDEWGNPNDIDYYNYMLSYSPYDQIKATDYPHMLVTSGLHDSQVQFWEPTKYVAKLREMKTNDSLILLKTNMDAGHGGASDRYEQLKELATEYSFILWLNEQ